MQASEILISVFSYNRPRELDLCLRSIHDHTICWVIVFDDRSDDPCVAEVAARHNIEIISGSGSSGRLGGLYSNI